MVAVGFPFAVELTYPLPEALSNGLMITSCLVLSSVVSIIASKVDGLVTVAIFIAFLMVGFFAAFGIDQKLNRMDLDEVKQSMFVEEG
jgi:hypothetical protein